MLLRVCAALGLVFILLATCMTLTHAMENIRPGYVVVLIVANLVVYLSIIHEDFLP